ncbi:MAG: hypothetical protein AB7O78_09110 [Thermoleophilia bacterium]
MRPARSRVLLSLSCMAAIAVLASGCTFVESVGLGGGGLGASRQTIRICASGPTCPDKGNSAQNASSGLRQILVSALVPVDVIAPATLTSSPPIVISFTESPGLAAELQGVQPAPPGQKWVGWISPQLTYSTDPGAPQELFIPADWRYPAGPDGSPSAATSVTAIWGAGWRNVIPRATASRPVSCGNSPTTFNADVPDNGDGNGPGVTFCLDSQKKVTSTAGDYGVVATGARASGTPGSLVSMPFVLRNGNIDQSTDVHPVKATSTLPGATIAVTPQALADPPKNGLVTAVVAVGIPGNAAPGVYDVTFTVDLGVFGAGTVRTGTGKLTVVAAPPGGGAGGGGGKPAKRKISTILPKDLSVATALRSGVPVLLGSNVAGPAVVRFQQGPKRRPTVSVGKRIRLKAPGPVKVTFRSRKLVKGPFRITVSIAGKVVKTAGGRLAK